MRTLIVVGVVVAACATAQASLSNLVGAWGHDFAVTPFEPMELMVAAAKDRKNGDVKFNIVKMPTGTMMALVPLDQVKEMPVIASKDMMMVK